MEGWLKMMPLTFADDCQRQRGLSGHQQGNGREDHDLSHGQKEKDMKTLGEVKVGETVKVVKLHGEGAIRRRIMDMGITKGVEIRIRKFAPLGDPIEMSVRGYELTLRKADAEMIEVE